MPVTLDEKADSQSGTPGDRGRLALEYWAKGSDDYDDIYAQVLTDAPTSFQGLVRLEPDIRPSYITGDGNGRWDVTVPYGPLELQPKQIGYQYYRGRTRGGSQHITHSKETVVRSTFVDSYNPPDYKRAINARKEGGKVTVDGVDIPAPVFEFEVGWAMAAADVTAAFIATLYALTAHTNNATWWGFPAGEVLFLGAEFEKRGTGLWDFVFYFAANPNVTALDFGVITGVDKKGWEYLWVEYAPTEDATAKAIYPGAVQVSVERVFDPGDFGDLGIGTSAPAAL